MTILSKLSLSDKTKAAMLTSPEAKLRGKMLEALDLQMEAAKAMLNGDTYIRRAMRWVDDSETGERVSRLCARRAAYKMRASLWRPCAVLGRVLAAPNLTRPPRSLPAWAPRCPAAAPVGRQCRPPGARPGPAGCRVPCVA